MKIVVAQFWTNNISYSEYSKKINESYCEDKNIIYHYEDNDFIIKNECGNRSFTWYKPKFIKKVLDLYDCDYVLFLDVDAVIVNKKHNIDEFIDSNYDCIVTKDHGPSIMNAGVLIFKKSEWTYKFLDEWWEISDKLMGPSGQPQGYYNTGLWHDQTCFGELYGKYTDKIKIIENRILNSREFNDECFVFHAFAFGHVKNRTIDKVYYQLNNIPYDESNDLTEISKFYNTDKVYEHDYINLIYGRLFNPIKNDVKTFVEIGVYNGESIRLWSDFFTNSQIIGLDNNHTLINSIELKNNNIKIINFDQSKIEDLEYFSDTFQNVDVILDDGSHKMYDQQITFAKLFKTLKSGGIYIIEDLHTSIEVGMPEKSWCNWGDPEKITTLELLEDYKKFGKIKNDYINAEDSVYLENNIESVDIYRKTQNWSITSVIIKK